MRALQELNRIHVDGHTNAARDLGAQFVEATQGLSKRSASRGTQEHAPAEGAANAKNRCRRRTEDGDVWLSQYRGETLSERDGLAFVAAFDAEIHEV